MTNWLSFTYIKLDFVFKHNLIKEHIEVARVEIKNPFITSSSIKIKIKLFYAFGMEFVIFSST
jgi:hypothetical protein